jgi:tetrahydromethanopterin S-methyltransferase subunit G
MNQDQVKERLLKLQDNVAEFKLIFSGKESKKVDGLYHPETMEIIIHNKNFEDDNSLMYTAIHEFAHHVQFTEHDAEVKKRAHTVLFWNIFHRLLERAEEMGIYRNIFEEDNKFNSLTDEIKKKYLKTNGELMKNFGKVLIQALDLCQQKHAIFEDYVDRALGLNRTAAKSIMKVYAMDVKPELGYDNMKIVASIGDSKQRQQAEEAFIEGKSQDMVRQEIKEATPAQDETLGRLESQKRRVEKSITELQSRLEELETKIDNFQPKDGDQ